MMSKMEKSGEQLLRDIQEWISTEKLSKECTVLPKDTLQHNIVGVSNQIIEFYSDH